MNWLGLLPIATGVIYLVYSILCKNKVTIKNKNDKMIIINKEKFLKLQLYFSIINSLYMMILGLIIIMYNLENIYVIASPIPFHFINYLLKVISKQKGYIKFRRE